VSGPDILVLTGGVGGAKLLKGLAEVVQPARICAAVNTGDDFDHLGLRVCPDLDTTVYTLAGLADPVRGWGRRDESWSFMAAVKELGAPTWFQLGDRDLALNVLRTQALAAGASLSEFTARTCGELGVEVCVLPMSDDEVCTELDTDEGRLSFQDYFVRRRCEPEVRQIHYRGAAAARPNPALLDMLGAPSTQAILIAPSNPWLSVGPILALPGLREALQAAPAPVVAVSPIVGGAALKGPTAKLMQEQALEVSAAAVAGHYGGLIDAFVMDERDAALADRLTVPVQLTNTVMDSDAVKRQLARVVLDFAGRLSAKAPRVAAR